MTDPVAHMRDLQRHWEAETRRAGGTLKQQLAQRQAELADRMPMVEAQGYIDKYTDEILKEAEALQNRISLRKSLKILFWLLMSPLILITGICLYAMQQL